MTETTPRGGPAWPLRPDCAADLFRGTADFYARYRVPYPPEFLADLLGHAQVTGSGRLLDLACGTGELAIPLSSSFAEVWAVDQEPEMVEAGQAKAAEQGVGNVRWSAGRAEELQAPAGWFELVTIGSAFHRLDRPAIAAKVWDWLEPGRHLAVVASSSIWSSKAPWQPAVVEVINRWTGRPPATPNGGEQPSLSHEEVLAAAGYIDVEEHTLGHRHTWTADSLIGYLNSTSVASRPALGERVGPFEDELRRVLAEFDPSGRYEETVQFFMLLGKRPAT